MSILTAPKLKFSHGFKMYVIFTISGKMRVIGLMLVNSHSNSDMSLWYSNGVMRFVQKFFTVTSSAWCRLQNAIVLIRENDL